MSARVLPLLCILTFRLGSAPAEPPAAAAPWAQEERLAAESLTHEARSLGHRRGGSDVARAGRILVLLRFARRICPSDVEANRQIIDIYEGTGNLKRAADAARVCVEADGRDYACAVRWMRLSLETLNTAERRIGLLKGVAGREDLSKCIRAAAAARLSQIHQGQGDTVKARLTCRQALNLDPNEPTALRMRGQFEKPAGPVRPFETALNLFGGNPRGLSEAWRVGQMLQGAGLYEKSLGFYEHAYALAEATRPGAHLHEALLIDYFNAMLDAGLAGRAVEFFSPHLKRHRRSLALHGLMVEACRSVGNDEKAGAHVRAMGEIYRPLVTPGASRSGAQSAELAWFNLLFRSRPKIALGWAQEAVKSAGDDPFVRRVFAAAQLGMGQTASGTRGLSKLIDKDPYAAAILAKHYYEKDNDAEGRKVLLKGLVDIRTGPGWRALAATAAKRKVELPGVARADKMREALGKVPAHLLEMGRFPERFVRVELIAPKARVMLGEPVAVTVVIKNVSQHRLGLGAGGLFNAVVFLSAVAEGPARTALPDLTLVTLPAPKYLDAGQEVRRTVRLDVGAAETVLMDHPDAEIKLTVSAMLDPLQEAGKSFSSAPGIKIAPVTIRRSALFDVSAGKDSARKSLGYIVGDLKRGRLPARVRATRQTASLLRLVRKVELGKARPVLPDVLTKPILMSITKAFLEAPSPLVRAEMLDALRHVDLDAKIIALMGPRIEDDSALVRMRLIELLAAGRTKGHETMLTYFAADQDSLVRQMAKALAGK